MVSTRSWTYTLFTSIKKVSAVAILVIAVADASWATQCQLKRVASIDLTTVSDGLLVPVTVNDHSAWMVFDTADIATVLWSDDAKQFGVSTHSLPSSAEVDFGKIRITRIAVPESFSLGSVKFAKSEFFLVPQPASRQSVSNKHVIGVLGLDALGNFDFELDPANSKLNLYSQDHCPGAVVYWTDKYSSARITRGPLGNYYFPMELDGKKIQSTISTADAGNSLQVEVTKRLYDFDEKSDGIETETDPEGQSQSHYRAMAITGDGIKVTNARVRLLTKKPQNCTLTSSGGAAIYQGCMGTEAPLKLGLNVAQHLHLYFATKERVLYFSDATASK